MIKRAIFLGVLVALFAGVLALSGCSDPQEAQRESLDDAIHDVEQAIGGYFTVDPQGSARELDRITGRVSSAWEAARQEAVGLDEIDTAAADAALESLVDATAGLDDDLPAFEALGILEPYIEAFDEEVEEIHGALDMH